MEEFDKKIEEMTIEMNNYIKNRNYPNYLG